MKRELCSVGGLVVVLAGCAPAADTAQGDDSQASVDEVRVAAATGTLTFYGCAPSAGRVRVTATRPRGGVATRALEAAPRPGGIAVPTRAAAATVRATDRVNVLRFDFSRMAVAAWQLSVEVNDPRCTGVAWRGPMNGLFAPGGGAIRVEGIVPTTRTVVLRPGDASGTGYAAERVSLDGPGTTIRTLRVESDLRAANGYELQVSVERPDVNDTRARAGRCVDTSGVIHRERIEVRPGARAQVPVDIARVLALADRAAATSDSPPRYEAAFRRGRPLYVRAVPITADCAPAAQGASSWVGLVHVPAAAVATISDGVPPFMISGEFSPVSTAPPVEPRPERRVYQTTADHVFPNTSTIDGLVQGIVADPMGAMLVLSGAVGSGAQLPKGTYFWFDPGSGSSGGLLGGITGTFGDLASGAVDAVAWAVNQASATYQAIKTKAASAVAAAVDALPGVSCDSACRAGIALGIEAGLVAAGMPPSLPNFDQLTTMGTDYLVALAAEQAGVPPSAAQVVTQAAVARMRESRGIGATPRDDWFNVAHPFTRAVTTLRIAATGTSAQRPAEFRIGSLPFVLQDVPLPAAPGTWTIPVVHEPTSVELPPPPSSSEYYVRWYYENAWRMSQYDSRACLGFLYIGHSVPTGPGNLAFSVNVPNQTTGFGGVGWSWPDATHLCE